MHFAENMSTSGAPRTISSAKFISMRCTAAQSCVACAEPGTCEFAAFSAACRPGITVKPLVGPGSKNVAWMAICVASRVTPTNWYLPERIWVTQTFCGGAETVRLTPIFAHAALTASQASACPSCGEQLMAAEKPCG